MYTDIDIDMLMKRSLNMYIYRYLHYIYIYTYLSICISPKQGCFALYILCGSKSREVCALLLAVDALLRLPSSQLAGNPFAGGLERLSSCDKRGTLTL